MITMRFKGEVKKSDDVIMEDVPNSKGIKIQWLISEEDGSERISMRKFTMEPGGDMKLHVHPDTEHVQYYLKGRVKLVIESKEYHVGSGDCIFIPAGVKHKYVNTGDEKAVFLCMIPSGEVETNMAE